VDVAAIQCTDRVLEVWPESRVVAYHLMNVRRSRHSNVLCVEWGRRENKDHFAKVAKTSQHTCRLDDIADIP